MKKYMLFTACCISMSFYAQKEDVAFFAGANFQQVSSKNQISVDLTGRYYLEDRLSIGAQFQFHSKNYNEGFGYRTNRTILNNSVINAVVQYDFVQKDQIIASAFVGNGINMIGLRNLNDVRVEQYYDPETYLYYDEVTPKILKKEVVYVFTPGVDISFKIATLGKTDKLGLYLTSRAGYQFSFGENSFTGSNNSNTFTGSFGITLKGASRKTN